MKFLKHYEGNCGEPHAEETWHMEQEGEEGG